MNINEHDKKEIKDCILLKNKVIGTRSSGKTFQAYQQENERLNNIINEITKLVEDYEELEKILGTGQPRFPLYKLQKIVKELKENEYEKEKN